MKKELVELLEGKNTLEKALEHLKKQGLKPTLLPIKQTEHIKVLKRGKDFQIVAYKEGTPITKQNNPEYLEEGHTYKEGDISQYKKGICAFSHNPSNIFVFE